MTRNQAIYLIEQSRIDFVHGIESKAGMRFKDNERVIRAIRMEYYKVDFDPTDFTRMDEIENIPDQWIKDNVDRIMNNLGELDWHYSNKDKWI